MDTDDMTLQQGAGMVGTPQTSGSRVEDRAGGAVAAFATEPDYVPLADDDEWMISRPARGVRLRVPTLVLLALLVAAGAFWGGSVAQRHHGSGATTAASAARIAATRGAGGFGGFGGATGSAGGTGATAAAPATSGTVTDVKGTIVYVTNASGALVKVSIGPTTTVTRTGTGSPGSLQIGDTAIVQGSAGADGTVAATAIMATAAGLPSPAATSGTGSAAGAGG